MAYFLGTLGSPLPLPGGVGGLSGLSSLGGLSGLSSVGGLGGLSSLSGLEGGRR